MTRYYVVFKGRCPGIYTSWQSASQEVLHETGAVHRSFTTFQEAVHALETYNNTFRNQPIALPVQGHQPEVNASALQNSNPRPLILPRPAPQPIPNSVNGNGPNPASPTVNVHAMMATNGTTTTCRIPAEHGLLPSIDTMITKLKAQRELFLIYQRGHMFNIFRKGSEEMYIVDMYMRTCSCIEWQNEGIPCAHAVAALAPKVHDWTLYCSPHFTIRQYVHLHCGDPFYAENPVKDMFVEARYCTICAMKKTTNEEED